MKKIIYIILCLIFYNNSLIAQQSVTISGQTIVEVGIPYIFTFEFTPVYPTVNNITADSYVITDWIVTTQTNGQGSSPSGYIGTSSNSGSYYIDSTYNGSNPISVPIQWGSGGNVALNYDTITVKVSGIYKKNSTGENVDYFNYLTATKSVTIERINAPIITGPNPINSCNQANQTYSYSNATNSNIRLWTVSNGGTIVGSNSGTSVVVKPPLMGSFTVNCEVKRSAANSNYIKTGTKTITRNAFSSSASITGSSLICTTTPYSMSGLLADEYVSSWSLSNSNYATISSTSGNSTNVSKIANGLVTLNAIITNACGETTSKSVDLIIGSAIPNDRFVVGNSCVAYNTFQYYTLNGAAIPNVTSYTWSVVAPVNDDGGPTCAWQLMTGQGTKTVKYKVGCMDATAIVRVQTTNSCGISNYKYLYVSVNSAGNCNYRLANIRHNDGFYYTDLISNEENLYLDSLDSKDFSNASLFDLNGVKVKSFNSNQYDCSDLSKGIYILKVETKSEIVTSKIIIN